MYNTLVQHSTDEDSLGQNSCLCMHLHQHSPCISTAILIARIVHVCVQKEYIGYEWPWMRMHIYRRVRIISP